ncbi:MAG: hypothetical protein ABR579_04240 [Actinomycetota bacterium]
MDIEEEVVKLDAEIATGESDMLQLEARLAGLRAQRDTLARALQRPSLAGDLLSATPPVSLRLLSRTDAILDVVRGRARPLTIQEVLNALREGGREETDYQVVATTLNQLARSGRLGKPARGVYGAAS